MSMEFVGGLFAALLFSGLSLGVAFTVCRRGFKKRGFRRFFGGFFARLGADGGKRHILISDI